MHVSTHTHTRAEDPELQQERRYDRQAQSLEVVEELIMKQEQQK